MSSGISLTGSQLSNLLSSSALQATGNSANTSTTGSSLAIAGVASGVNWQTIVEELAQAERAPETEWESQQSAINAQNSAFTTIANDLTALQTDVQNLQDPTL